MILLAVIALVLFRHTVGLIGATWISSRTFSHGFLIVPIFLYLVWIRRERVLALRPEPNYWMLPVLGVVAGIWLVASLGEIHVVQEFALVGMLEAMVWTVLGTKTVRVLWFPLLFLFFAVPFGETAIGPLQDFTAHFAVACLRLSHVPVILENRTISVPSGPWVVAQACSGIRYLISSLVLGLVYASLIYRSKLRRALFVLASILVPIVANGIRAYGIILLAYLTNNRLAAGVDHIIYGWIFFTAIQLLLFSVGLRWRDADQPSEEHGAPGEPPRKLTSFRALSGAAICALILLVLAPAAQAYLWNRAAGNRSIPALAVKAPWHLVPPYSHDWAPLLHPTSEFNGSYVSSNQDVDVYLASYSGRQGVELVSDYNHVSDPRVWSELSGGFREAIINGHAATIRWEVIQSPAASRLVWRWYWTGGQPTADPTRVKLAQTKARVLARPTSLAVMAISTEFLRGPAEAADRLQDFLNHSSIVLSSRAAIY